MDSLNRLSGESKSVESSKLDDQSSIADDLSYQSPTEENFNLINELQQSFGSSTFYVSSPLISRNKKTPTDKAYCLAKELLMTERTYRKDLEIINVVFREEFYKQFSLQCSAVEEMLKMINPLYEKHCFLLRDLEQRLAFWESRPVTRTQNGIKGIGDILLNSKEMIQAHQEYLKNLPNVLELVQKLIWDEELSVFYQQFEANKLCYLPLTSFLLRPAFRLPYYSSLLKYLLDCYDNQHVDYDFCLEALECLKPFCESFDDKILPIINYVKLMELQRSLIGFPNLLNKKREFIREGCLLKFSQNGCHQHMFFLFSDIVLYTTKIHNSNFRFKVQGQIPTSDLKVEDTEPKHGIKNCISLCSGTKHIVVSASSDKEYLKWMGDFKKTLYSTQSNQLSSCNSSSHTSRSFSDDNYESSDDAADDITSMRDEKPVSHLVNTSIHVCWHRNISISSCDLLISLKHSISGYLLRKFKNNSGWQKLWVVLANLCLFFYKSYLDESPLASLPLAGYRISTTTNSDIVHGECIFKLRFKSHKYFFMVENKHTFGRWMEAINCCTLAEEENTRL